MIAWRTIPLAAVYSTVRVTTRREFTQGISRTPDVE
jgi:hypothetical protein